MNLCPLQTAAFRLMITGGRSQSDALDSDVLHKQELTIPCEAKRFFLPVIFQRRAPECISKRNGGFSRGI